LFHGKKLIDHSLNIDCEVCDAMERSETEVDEINYERSTTNDLYSNETIILTDLLHSTPVDGDYVTDFVNFSFTLFHSVTKFMISFNWS
jgi:hypothetical protein